jgi:GDP-L-fucose synthase
VRAKPGLDAGTGVRVQMGAHDRHAGPSHGGVGVLPLTEPAPSFPLRGRRVFVAGHRGMVGSALVRRLRDEDCEVLTVARGDLDLRRQAETEAWITASRPDVVFIAAARVGGILANRDYPADFLFDNVMIGANVMEASRRAGVERLVFIGSSCIYPKFAAQPIREEELLTGPLEPTNEPYAIAKIAGIRLAQAYRRQHGCRYIAVQPCNLYGPGDNFDLASSHVLPALMRKAHEARRAGHERMEIWGSGKPLREFLHVDDLADALVFLARHYDGSDLVNVGSGEELSIRALAESIAEVVGFRGTFDFDATKPDGTPRKVLDLTRLHGLGWRHSIALGAGLASTYEWFLSHHRERVAE